MRKLPEERENEREGEGRPKRTGEFDQMSEMMRATMGEDRAAGIMLGDRLREAGLGQDQMSEDVYQKVLERLENLPIEMPMTQAAIDRSTSREISGGDMQERTMRILEPMMPYMMAMDMMRVMAPGGGRQRQQGRSDIEDRIMDHAVKQMLGEAETSSSKVVRQLQGLRSDIKSEGGTGTSALGKLAEGAEEVKEGVEAFEGAADALGFTKEDKSDLEKVKELMDSGGNLLKRIKERVGSTPKPKKGSVQKPSGLETESEEEEEGPIPVEKGKKEETEEKPEASEESETPKPEESEESEESESE